LSDCHGDSREDLNVGLLWTSSCEGFLHDSREDVDTGSSPSHGTAAFEDAADYRALTQHVVVVVAPLVGRARGRGALQDQGYPGYWRITPQRLSVGDNPSWLYSARDCCRTYAQAEPLLSPQGVEGGWKAMLLCRARRPRPRGTAPGNRRSH